MTALQKPWTDEEGTLHEDYRAAFFLRQSPAGVSTFDPGSQPLMRWRRSSLAWFCPFCGDVWARALLTDSTEKLSAFEVFTVSCEQHPDYWNIPGSLLSRGLEGLLEVLPEVLLKRELELSLRNIK